MLCSARELGLGEDQDGILELDTDAAPGTTAARRRCPVADSRLVVDVTPNRPDLLGHKGVARELAASYGTPFRLPQIPAPTRSTSRRRAVPARPTPSTAFRITHRGPGVVPPVPRRGDPRGRGRPRRPTWLRRRLEAVGVRSINNVVDATNYVMLELNQPMHAYDLARAPGRRRWSSAGRGRASGS